VAAVSVSELEAEILAIATALGVVRDGQLSTAFFSDPLAHLRTIISDAQQRTALTSALDALLPPPDGASHDGDASTTRHPIAHTAHGIVAISITRSGQASDPTVVVGVWATAAPTAGGFAVEVDLPLVQGSDSGLDVVAASQAHPLMVAASAAVGWDTADRPIGLSSVSLSALVVAPPHVDSSRIALLLTGLDLGDGPSDLVLDPQDLADELGQILTSLLRAGLAQAGSSSELVTALLTHLPSILGLDGKLPTLPLGKLVSDAGAFRDWLGSLVSATVGGRPALVDWLDHVGQLLGAPALQATLSALPGPDSPVTIPIVDGGADGFGVQIIAYVQTPAASTTPELHVSIAAGIGGEIATARGEAELLVVPLGGDAPARTLTMAQLVTESSGPLWPRSGSTDDQLRVGVARAGLRYDGAHVVPVLELDDVHVDISGVVTTATDFDRLDLTQAKTLAASANTALQTFFTDQLGNSPIAQAILGLIGLGDATADQFAAFANDPLRAIGAFHRQALQANNYAPIAQQIVALFGVDAAVSGSGTASDPWFAELAAAPLPATSSLGLGIAVWDVLAGQDHTLHLGLRLATPAATAPGWSLSLDLDLLTFALPAAAAMHAGILGGIDLKVELRPGFGTGATVTADSIVVGTGWAPGSPAQVDGSITGVTVTVDGSPVTIGDIELPDGLSAQLIDDAWHAVRVLLGRIAGTWGGTTGALVAALLGLETEIGGLPSSWPALELPSGGISALLADPTEFLRDRLGALIAGATAPDGQIPLLAALDMIASALGGSLPAIPRPDLPLLSTGPAISGSGTYDDPWALALTDPSTPLVGQPADLIAWLEPGPPTGWAQTVQDAVGLAQAPIAEFLGDLRPWLGEVRDATTALDPALAARWLAAAANAIDGTDGLAAADIDDVLPAGAVASDPVIAAHHLVPQNADAVAAVTAHLQNNAAGVPVLLLAPSFAPADVWSPLLAALPAGAHTTIDLNVPGIDPDRVDLGAVSSAAYYLVDLADDGSATLDKLIARLDRVVQQVKTVTRAGKVALVAHSTAGLVAIHYAATATVRANCQALVTLAAPLVALDTTLALTGEMASGVRLARALAPEGLSAAPALDAALGQLSTALDGCVGGTPSPFPVAAFARTLPAATDLSAVPSLAVPAQLDSPLGDALSTAFASALTGQSATSPAPTHLSWGLRARVDLGTTAATSGPQVDVRARLDIGRVALVKGSADPPHPERRFAVNATLSDASGWLVGSGGTGAPLEARLRAAQIAFVDTPGAAVEFDVTLYDASVRGAGGARLGLDAAQAPQLLGALAHALAAADTSSACGTLLQALEAIGLVAYDSAAKTASFYSDAIAALRADPAGYLSARLPAALDSAAGLLGLTTGPATAAGPQTWRRTLGSLPLELLISSDPWTVELHTTSDLRFAGASLAVDARLPLNSAGPPTLDASLAAAGVTLTYAGESGTLTLSAPPVLQTLTLLPRPTGSALADDLLRALGTTGLSAAISAALRDALGGAVPVGPLAGLFSDPAGWLSETGRLGLAGGGFDASRVSALLEAVGRGLGLSVASDGSLTIATGMTLKAAAGSATGELDLSLTATDLALGDGLTLGTTLGLQIVPAAGQRRVQADGTLSLTVPLGAAGWGSLTVTAGAAPSGITLAIATGSAASVELLPQFGGLWDLIGGGVEALLPGVLDGLVERLEGVTTSPLFTDALDLVDALGLRTGTPKKFDSTALAGLVQDITSGHLIPAPDKLAAIVNALLPAGAPVTVTAGPPVTIDVTALPVPGTASFKIGLPSGAGSSPSIAISLASLGLGPVQADLTVSEAGGTFGVQTTLAVALPDSVDNELGFTLAPSMNLDATAGGALTISLSPLGEGNPPQIDLAPTPGVQRTDLGALLEAWAVPIIARVALQAAAAELELALWAGGPTAHQLLEDAGLVDDSSGTVLPHRPLPAPMELLRGLLAALGALRIPVTSELNIGIYTEGTRIGVGANGQIDIPAGDFTISPLLGSPEVSSWTDPPPGLGVLIFDDASGLTLSPGVRFGGVGLRVARTSGSLIDTSEIKVGAITGMAQAAIELGDHVNATNVHGGVNIEKVGLPLGGSSDPSNPVAASLLKPSGDSGDDQPADPPSDLLVVSDDSGTLTVEINGTDSSQPLYIDIQKTFGPLHIDRIGLLHKLLAAGDAVGALVDGGVAIAGLSVDVDGLELDIPLKHPAELDQWSVDLAGLSVAFSSGPVEIAGGLLKIEGSDGGVEYDGEVKVQVESFGLTALGSYARSGGSDPFTSLFVFLVVDAPIGGPPYLFITGLAAGAGYNRQLIVPGDPALIPNFPLVSAMDSGSSPADPMAQLHQMSAAMPPRRGSYWIAAGVKFTTFELLNTRALAYVALDRGFTIGLVGLMDMALPAPDAAIVSVELALSASYSSADQLLSIRAQLTNNSWLISEDCQLTGGFAFMAWFGEHSQVLLTIGGFGPHWQISPSDPHASQYPVVPAVGFHWSVGGGIVVKGETYFALTPHQLAFGGRLEASYDVDPIRVWFMVYLDVDIQFDPLTYHLDAGIGIGAAFHFTIDLLFGSITINVSVSLSASLTIDGPPCVGASPSIWTSRRSRSRLGTRPSSSTWAGATSSPSTPV
jgi:large repetitive protein